METHTFDASAEPLGRMASRIATILMGKHHPSVQHHVKEPIRVVVTQSDRVRLSGRKWDQKLYHRHSGYLGKLKTFTADWVRQHDSRRLVSLAVWGMLPKNKLRRRLIKNLVIYKGEMHEKEPRS